jgi:hypothetical protein
MTGKGKIPSNFQISQNCIFSRNLTIFRRAEELEDIKKEKEAKLNEG